MRAMRFLHGFQLIEFAYEIGLPAGCDGMDYPVNVGCRNSFTPSQSQPERLKNKNGTAAEMTISKMANG
jgi:hypothetical protein